MRRRRHAFPARRTHLFPSWESSFSRRELLEEFRGFFVEVLPAILAAEFYFLPIMDEGVGFAVSAKFFISDDARLERIRFRSGRTMRVGGMIVAGLAADERDCASRKQSGGDEE